MPMEEDRRGGHSALTVVVRRQTVEELHRKGIKANPESAVYKNTFNRLAAKYRHDQAAMMKDRKKQNDAWLEEHANDTDEQLIAYLRGAVTDPAQCRKPGSVPGGYCLARRFGGWKKALAAAGVTEAEEPQPEKQAQPPPEEPQTPPEEQSAIKMRPLDTGAVDADKPEKQRPNPFPPPAGEGAAALKD